jgi:ABC-2 type transport system permease protein
MRSSVSVGLAARWNGETPAGRVLAVWQEYLVDLVVVLTAYLVATYWRQELPFGKFVGFNYEWHSPKLYVTIALSLAVAYALRVALHDAPFLRSSAHFRTLLAGIIFVCLGVTVLLPHQSTLQKGYFFLLAVVFSMLVVPIHDDPQRVERIPSLWESLKRLWTARSLLRMWVQYSVHSRYSQAILGVLWIILLPLSTAFVMSVVFSQIMRVHTGNAPFIAFFLAGSVPFSLFSQSISGGMRSILGAMGLINQIYFPREIIVVSALGEALVDAFFMFCAMLVIDALFHVLPNVDYVFLPLIIVIQIALSLGLMLLTSWLTVLIRDIPQLVSVLLQILFYLSPIIYPSNIVPHRYQFLINLNPIGLLIVAYRDIIVYDRQPDWFSLIYPAALALAVLIFGYRQFKAHEDRFADMI